MDTWLAVLLFVGAWVTLAYLVGAALIMLQPVEAPHDPLLALAAIALPIGVVLVTVLLLGELTWYLRYRRPVRIPRPRIYPHFVRRGRWCL